MEFFRKFMRTLQFCKGVAKSLKMLFHVFKIMPYIVINKRLNSQKIQIRTRVVQYVKKKKSLEII